MNIAVVDDEARSREALSHFVEKYSKETGRVLSVECFATADEFLSVYKKNFFSIVLMDIELPGIDGLAAAKELEKQGIARVLRPSEHIKVSKVEKNPDKLESLYQLGIRDAERFLAG